MGTEGEAGRDTALLRRLRLTAGRDTQGPTADMAVVAGTVVQAEAVVGTVAQAEAVVGTADLEDLEDPAMEATAAATLKLAMKATAGRAGVMAAAALVGMVEAGRVEAGRVGRAGTVVMVVVANMVDMVDREGMVRDLDQDVVHLLHMRSLRGGGGMGGIE